MLTVGVDLGGTNIATLVLGDDDAQLGSSKMRTPTGGTRPEVVDVIHASVHQALDAAGMSIEDVDAVGIGTPGVVLDGTVGGASNVPGWLERFDLGELLRQSLDRPIKVSNDVTAAAVAEHRAGAARGHDQALVVNVGTGVGGGLILDGKAFEGRSGGAGEFGHMVVNVGGAICPCGRRGCVEAYAGRRAMSQAADRARLAGKPTVLFDVMESAGKHRPTSGVWRDALAAGDGLVADLLDEGIAALGAAIASVVNLLDVDICVLGGGLADKLGEWYRIRLDAAIRPHLFLQPSVLTMVPAELGDASGMLGAALLARELVA